MRVNPYFGRRSDDIPRIEVGADNVGKRGAPDPVWHCVLGARRSVVATARKRGWNILQTPATDAMSMSARSSTA